MQTSDIISGLSKLWNFHIFSVEGSTITLGKLIVGLIFLGLGYNLSKLMSKALSQRIIGRFHLQRSMQFTLERFSFYVLFAFFVLFTLQLLSIPITIFTVVGGALAIGIGFGSQNIVNNFISGLIVMIEQPVRVGDWIEIEGIFGLVEQIGGRSTIMRTQQNKQVVVPNSYFLEKVVTNWTLGDSRISGSVAVGVAYGSNTNLVNELLVKAAVNHPNVIKDPAPFVYFQDFGESSLNFNLYFNIYFSAESTVAKVASDIRFQIDELFRVNNITIPFPHRELIIRQQSKSGEG